MRRIAISIVFALLLVPSAALAKETVWNMKGVAKLEGWNHKGFSKINLTPDGLFMQTEAQGQLARKGPITHGVDTMTISYSSPTGASGIFFWQTPDQVGNNAYNIPIQFSPSPNATSMVLDLSKLKEWTPKSKLIGFNLNAGSQMVLHSITFAGPSFKDTLVNSAQSVFTLDEYKGYSVNFLWGPRLVSTPEAISRVYDKMPPLGSSWNKVLYAVVLLTFVVSFILAKVRGGRVLVPVLISICTVWLIYDARMGIEILGYAKKDWSTWWSKPIELKDYRDRGSFTAYTKVAREFVQDEEYYALITPTGWPYFGIMTYETYPALPRSSTDDLTDIHYWFVYRMRNADVNADGQITLDDEPISPPGEVVLNFEPGSFMFRTLK